MRVILLGLLITLPALACPDLQGFYKTCTSSTGAMSPVSNLTISQTGNAYTFSSEVSVDFIADGVTRISEQGQFKTSQKYFCENNTLVGISKISMNGMPMGEFRMDVTKAGNILSTEMTGTLFGNNVYDTQTCE